MCLEVKMSYPNQTCRELEGINEPGEQCLHVVRSAQEDELSPRLSLAAKDGRGTGRWVGDRMDPQLAQQLATS